MELNNAIIDKITSMKDGSFKITLVTRELSPEQMAEILCNLNSEVVQITVPDELADTKSPSKRLKDRMFVYFKNKYKESKGFSNWYINALDEIGINYLEQIKE